MAIDGRKYFDAAKGKKRELSNAFDSADVDTLKPPEETGLDNVVQSANKFLYFANGDTAVGRRNIEVDAGFSGSVSSVILGSSAPNYDTGMGGSAGKQDEKKKQEEWDRLFRLQQELAQRLQEIDWEIEKVDKKIHDTKEHMSKLDREKAELEELRGIFDDHLSGKKPLKVGADGRLENEKAEKALQEFERRTGKKVDRKNPDELDAAMRDMKRETSKRIQEIDQDRKECEERLKQYGDERNKWETQKTETQEKKSKVDESIDNMKEGWATGDQKKVIKAQATEADARNITSGEIDFGLDLETGYKASIDLNTSAASRIDQDSNNASMRSSFKAAHGALQAPDDAQSTELSRQDKAPVVKSPV